MRVRKRTYRDGDGNVRTLDKYYVIFNDPSGVTRSLAGFTDKAATEQLGKKLQRLSSLRAVDEPPDVDLLNSFGGFRSDSLTTWPSGT